MTFSNPASADQIKAWRLGLKWTQETAAKELGLQLRQYQNIESGVTPVKLTIQKLAGYIARERGG